MLMNEKVKTLVNRWKDDYQFKTIVSSSIAAIVGLFFIIFNGVLGFAYGSVWHASICGYYVLLFVIRLIVIAKARSVLIKKAGNVPKEEISVKERRVYLITHILMLIMDIALIAPIAMMVKGAREYEYGLPSAVLMAIYTTYCVVTDIYEYMKAKKEDSLLIKELRTIALKDSLVAVLTLQNALIIAKGSEMMQMIGLTGWTSGGIWLVIVVISVLSFLRLRRGKHAGA